MRLAPSPSGTPRFRRILLLALGFASALGSLRAADRPNVLMIVVDDLGAAPIGHPAYGRTHPSVITPSIDRLCNEGLAFTQAYSNWPACMPARHGFLSGMLCEKSQWRHTGDIRNDDGRNRSAVYLPQHFRDNGYAALRLDKVFHIGIDKPDVWDLTEEPFKNADGSFRAVTQSSELDVLGLADNVRRDVKFTEMGGEKSEIKEMAATDETGAAITADRLTDGRTKLRALELLDDLATPGGAFDAAAKPFFFAVGFRRPHLPFCAAREYYGKYKWGAGDDNVTDPATPQIVLPPQNTAFTDEAAYRQSLEGYYAGLTQTDAHVGALLDKLDATGLAANTIVLLFGDNGYGLGEHNKFFSKGTPDNVAFHVPLVVRLPGGAGRPNQAEAKAVTLVDIYPTLVELCGLPKPATPLDGKSFAPLLAKPNPDYVEEAFSFLDGTNYSDHTAPLAAAIWADGLKYYQKADGSPGELYAVAKGDRFEWTNLINNSAYNAAEAKLKERLDSLRARSMAELAPEFVQHAPTQAVPAGQAALFTFREEGTEVLQCQWAKDGVDLPGETATSLLIPSVSATHAGIYAGRAVNSSGRTFTYRAQLKVLAAPDTLFDWQIDQRDAPFIIDGINGAAFTEITSLSQTFGPDALTAFNTSSGGHVFIRPGLPFGNYRVSQWNPSWSKRTTQAQYTVRHTGGETAVTVNQTATTGTWGLIGTGTYTLGVRSEVALSSDTPTNNVAVDGLRFERLSVPANHDPVAVDDGTHTTAPDAPVTVQVLANDSDADAGDALSILQIAGGRYGKVTFSGGAVTYAPRRGVANASETIRYQATDGKGRSNPASFTVTITQPAGTGTLETPTNGFGTVSRSPDQTAYAQGAVIRLSAVAYPGYQFYYWAGGTPSLENPIDVTIGGGVQLTAVFRPIPQQTTYALWAAAQPWATPGTDGARAANPDGDPFPNQLEYGMDLEALAPDAGAFAHALVPESGAETLRFRYRKSLRAQDTAFAVLTSPDLRDWTPFTGPQWIADFDPDGDFTAQEIECAIPAGPGRTFVRVGAATP